MSEPHPIHRQITACATFGRLIAQGQITLDECWPALVRAARRAAPSMTETEIGAVLMPHLFDAMQSGETEIAERKAYLQGGRDADRHHDLHVARHGGEKRVRRKKVRDPWTAADGAG